MVATTQVPVVEASDIQATVLRPRPSPYHGEYVLLRVGDAEQGREMLRRIIPHVATCRRVVEALLARLVGDRVHFRGPQGVGRAAGIAGQFPDRVPAGHGGTRRDPSRRRCECAQPTGTTRSARRTAHVALAIYAKDDEGLQRIPGASRARRSRTCRKSPLSIACSSANCRKDATHSDSRTVCTTPTSRAAVRRCGPAAERPSRPGSSSWAIPTSSARSPRRRFLRSCATTGLSSRFEISHGRCRVSSLPAGQRLLARGRGADCCKNGGPLAQRRSLGARAGP